MGEDTRAEVGTGWSPKIHQFVYNLLILFWGELKGLQP